MIASLIRLLRARRRVLLLVALLGALLQLSLGSAGAHGGGVPMLVNDAAGPYLLSVWMAPDPLRVGSVHLTVAVSEPAEDGNAGEPVLGAAVRVLLTAEDEPDVNPVGALATHQDATNRLFYEADVDVATAGNWRITVMVDGPLGRGESAFSAVIKPEATTNWFMVGAAGLALLAGVFLLVVFQRRRRRDRDRQTDSAGRQSRSDKEDERRKNAVAR